MKTGAREGQKRIRKRKGEREIVWSWEKQNIDERRGVNEKEIKADNKIYTKYRWAMESERKKEKGIYKAVNNITEPWKTRVRER